MEVTKAEAMLVWQLCNNAQAQAIRGIDAIQTHDKPIANAVRVNWISETVQEFNIIQGFKEKLAKIIKGE